MTELKLTKRQKSKLRNSIKNTTGIKVYKKDLERLINASMVQLSDISPSDWCEKYRMMTPDVSPIPGMFSYDNSPYLREIVDCLSSGHPMKRMAIMKGAQIGFSTGFIEAGIGWIISNSPGNILFLVGHEDLVKDAVKKVDRMIDSTGIRRLIKSTSQRKVNNKSGDTDSMKEFPDGYLKMGIANHKVLRNISMQYGFIDDYESMKGSTKQSGSTEKLIEQRFAAFDTKMKLCFISTPELKASSNIEPVYLKGDQRKYNVKAPCCGEWISIEWSVDSEVVPGEKAGITWDLDHNNELIESSVGYACQKCGCFFDDKEKTKLLRGGKWIPTAKPSEPGFYSYHLSALYAPAYMFGWTRYVRNYLDANPPGGKRDEEKWKTFKNLVLGETYEHVGQSVSANQLQKNIREYPIGILPEKQSIADGNGRIVLVTCGSDMNGKVDDARLDYEIVAYAENGATYGIDQGSVGTFIPKDKHPELREKMTYHHGAINSIWTEFSKIITKKYTKDTDGSEYGVMMTGIDTGYLPDFAYQFLDIMNSELIIGLKGQSEKGLRLNTNLKTFKKSASHARNYLVETNLTKDNLARKMGLNWNPTFHNVQPAGFMNFPQPSDGKYGFNGYFSHFEAEHKVIGSTGAFVWEKKTNNHQNHLYDCRLYSDVAKDVFLDKIFRDNKIKDGKWTDFVNMVYPA